MRFEVEHETTRPLSNAANGLGVHVSTIAGALLLGGGDSPRRVSRYVALGGGFRTYAEKDLTPGRSGTVHRWPAGAGYVGAGLQTSGVGVVVGAEVGTWLSSYTNCSGCIDPKAFPQLDPGVVVRVAVPLPGAGFAAGALSRRAESRRQSRRDRSRP